MVKEKECAKCGEFKAEDDFYKRNTKGRSGPASYCKCCHIKSVKEMGYQFKLKCIEYLGNKCKICEYNKCIAALDFHHLDPKIKEFGIAKFRRYSFDKRVKKELDKCILVCCRCHREIHAGMIDCDGNKLNSVFDNLKITIKNKRISTKKHFIFKVECKYCKKIFISVRSKNKKPKFCSRECVSDGQRKLTIDKFTLEKLIWEKPMTHIAKEFDVCDRAIGKRCKKLGIKIPPRGYWIKHK